MDRTLAIGRQVHYRHQGRCLPATVVRVWSEQTVNLVVLSDLDTPVVFDRAPLKGFTSIVHGLGEDQWHWPDEDDF